MKILLIEDNEDHAELIKDTCFDAFYSNCALDWYTHLATGWQRLEVKQYDILLLDLQLTDSSIEHTVAHLNSQSCAVPIIVLTSLGDEEIGRELVKSGIQDYLPKENLNKTLLQRMCSYAIERKQQQLKLEQKARDQTNFCYSLSHDFKAPIRNISQLSTLLQDALDSNQHTRREYAETFSQIENKLGVMTHLVDSLYHYIKVDTVSASKHKVNLNDTLQEVKNYILSDETKMVTIKSDELPMLLADSSQLFLMMKNLIENAIKYSVQKPRIEIRSKIIEPQLSAKFCELSFIDNGIGLQEEDYEMIFEPFHRLHTKKSYPGSGLGLSVVKRIVENHGGEIHVSSEVNKGSCFVITLPLSLID